MKNFKIKTLTVILFAALILSTLCLAACGGNRGHKVEFEVNGGNAISPMYSLDEINLPDAKRDGYTFNGWYKQIDEQGNVVGDRVASKYTVTEPVKLYADWLPFTLSEVFDGYEVAKAVSSLTELTVPGEFDGSKITSVALNAFSDCADIVKVTLPDSVNRIGTSAFKGCAKLSQMQLGADITEIKESTFEGCSSLGAIDISNVTGIGKAAFKGCSALQTLTVGNAVNVAADSFEGCTKLITENGGVKYINNCAVGVNSNVSVVNLKQEAVAVWGYAFKGSSIIQANLGKVEFVGDFAFADCKTLQAVTLDNSLKKIGNNAFYNCEALGGITLPASVEEIGSAAFYGCKELTSIALPQNVTAIKANTFKGCEKLESINLGHCLEFGVSAFEGCKAIATMGLDLQSATTIGAYAFKGCETITSVNLTSLKTLGSEAFAGTGISSVALPETLTSIGNSAFRGCKLTEVSYAGDLVDWAMIDFAENSNPVATAHNLQIKGEAVTDIVLFSTATKTINKISAYAFDGLGNINTLVLDRTITEIGNNAFRGCTVANVYYKGDDYGWSSLNKGDGNVFDENKVKAYGELTEITIPNSVTEIAAYAFEGCTNLTKVRISKNVTVIGDHAFSGCTGLTDVQVYEPSLTVIGDYAFSGCSSLKFFSTCDTITSIGNSAFADCYMFGGFALFASSITSIGEKAFINCSSFHILVFSGTQEQWDALPKGDDWDFGMGDYVVECYGDINKSQD